MIIMTMDYCEQEYNSDWEDGDDFFQADSDDDSSSTSGTGITKKKKIAPKIISAEAVQRHNNEILAVKSKLTWTTSKPTTAPAKSNSVQDLNFPQLGVQPVRKFLPTAPRHHHAEQVEPSPVIKNNAFHILRETETETETEESGFRVQKKRKRKQTLEVGFTGRMDRLKQERFHRYRRRHNRHSSSAARMHDKNRDKAFELLNDKATMEKRLVKTKMCNSVKFNKPCRHGKRCKFAHTLDELVIAQCFFGESCRFVKRTGENYENMPVRQKCCDYIHPHERREDFFRRIGVKNHPAPPSSLKVQVHDHRMSCGKPYKEETNPELVMKVPAVAALALQEIEKALKTGHQRIRVLIV